MYIKPSLYVVQRKISINDYTIRNYTNIRKPLHAKCSSKNNLDYISSIKLDKHAHENKYFVCANSFFNNTCVRSLNADI